MHPPGHTLSRRTENLFEALEKRTLTAEEQAVIDERVAHQRRMFEQFEKRERIRKITELREVCPDISEEEAERALDLCNGNEEEAASALVSDPLFKRRIQSKAMFDQATLYGSRQAKTGRNSQGSRRSSRLVGPRPKLVDASSLGDSVFVGAFRGKGFQSSGSRIRGTKTAALTGLPPPTSSNDGKNTIEESKMEDSPEDASDDGDATAPDPEDVESIDTTNKSPERRAAEEPDATSRETKHEEGSFHSIKKKNQKKTPTSSAKKWTLVKESSQGELEPITDSELVRVNKVVVEDDGKVQQEESDGDTTTTTTKDAESQQKPRTRSKKRKDRPENSRPSMKGPSAAAGRRLVGPSSAAELSASALQAMVHRVDEMETSSAVSWLAKMAPSVASAVLASFGEDNPEDAVILRDLLDQHQSSQSPTKHGMDFEASRDEVESQHDVTRTPVKPSLPKGSEAKMEVDNSSPSMDPVDGCHRAEKSKFDTRATEESGEAYAEGSFSATPSAKRDVNEQEETRTPRRSARINPSLAVEGSTPQTRNDTSNGGKEPDCAGLEDSEATQTESEGLHGNLTPISVDIEAGVINHAVKKRSPRGRSRRGAERYASSIAFREDDDGSASDSSGYGSSRSQRRRRRRQRSKRRKSSGGGSPSALTSSKRNSRTAIHHQRGGDASHGQVSEPSRTHSGQLNFSKAISSRGHTNRGRVRQKSHKSAELVDVGTLHPQKGWFNAGYIFPMGFVSRTLFRSSVALDQLCIHECSILGREGAHWPAPTFRVVAFDRPDEPLVAKSCTGCWSAVLRRINAEIEARRKEGEDLPPPPKTAIAGPEYFGLNQPNIVSDIEALDPEQLCTEYWSGKRERELAAAGLPVPASEGKSRPAARSNAAGRASRRSSGPSSRRRRTGPSESEEDDGDEDDQDQYTTSRWSAINRAERYRKRLEGSGEDASGLATLDDDNPLPDFIDPITLEPVIRPAISPFGHVMGAATWKAVLAESNGKCPFTKQPLRWEQCRVLTKHNIDAYKDSIIR